MGDAHEIKSVAREPSKRSGYGASRSTSPAAGRSTFIRPEKS